MGRTVQFLPDGRPRVVPAADVVAMWRRHSPVSAKYGLGTSDHESSRQANEVDTEVSGFISYGLTQVSKEEAMHVGMGDADLLDPETNIIVLAHLVDERTVAINRVLGWPQRNQDGTVIVPAAPDFLAYLTVAHNQGLAACIKTIAAHGMNWASYQQRNLDEAHAALAAAQSRLGSAASGAEIAAATTAIAVAKEKLVWWRNVFAYGNDCISGGPSWDPAFNLTA